MFLFKCGDHGKNNLKNVAKSQSKHMNLEEIKKYWIGEEYEKDCDTYIIRSNNQETYLQRVKNLHYLYLMTNDVIQMKLKVKLGIIHNCCFINRCKSKTKHWKDFLFQRKHY